MSDVCSLCGREIPATDVEEPQVWYVDEPSPDGPLFPWLPRHIYPADCGAPECFTFESVRP